jgi:tape measure domain-containing protein
MNLGAIRAALSLNIAQFSREMRRAMVAVKYMARHMERAFIGSGSAINGTNRAATQLNKTFYDMERIVGGILISQAFYQGAHAIQSAASNVVSFMNDMERAQISLEYFLGSPERAKGFLLNMKDFAADTAFNTQQALTLSRRLMAAQFKPTQVRSVMETLNDASVVSGGTAEEMDRIVLALSQVKTQGKLAGQEMRQFAEAQIPIYQILKEELGLTGDQLKNIGDMKIDADTAITAILKGLESRYDGAAKRIANTMGGMWDNIKDNSKFVAAEVFQAPYKLVEGYVRKVRDRLDHWRQIMTTDGVGAIFENIVPPDLQPKVRAIIGSLQSLAKSASILFKAFAPVAKIMGGMLVQSLYIVLPPIAAAARGIAQMTKAAMEGIAPLRFLVVAISTLFIATVAAKALMLLWKVTRIGVICAVVAQAVTMLSRALRILFLTMTKNPITGIIILIAGALLYLALSSKTASDMLDQLTARLSKLAGVDFSNIFKPIHNADITGIMEEFNEQVDLSGDGLKDVGKEAAEAGKKVKDKFVASFDELYQIPDQLDDLSSAADGLGDLDLGLPTMDVPDLGGLGEMFGPPKPPELDEDGWADIIKKLEEFYKYLQFLPAKYQKPPDGKDPFKENLKQTIDEVTNYSVKMFDTIKATFNNVPVVVGNAVSGVKEKLQGLFDIPVPNYAPVYSSVMDLGVNVKNSFTDWATTTYNTVTGWVSNTITTLSTWENNAKTTVGNWSLATINTLSSWATSAGTTIGNWATGTVNALATWSTNATTNVRGWANNTATNVNTWANATGKTLTSWANGTAGAIAKWSTLASTNVQKWAVNTSSNIASWALNAGANVGAFVSGAGNALANFMNGTATGFASWVTGVSGNVAAFGNAFMNGIGAVTSNVWNAFNDFLTGTASGTASWASSVISSIVDFAKSAWSTIKGLADAVGGSVSGAFNGTAASISNAFSGLGKYKEAAKDMLVPVGATAVAVAGSALAAGQNAAGAAAGAAGSFLGPFIGMLEEIHNQNFGSGSLPGFKTGSIIDHEMVARLGEGGKREAVIPLQDSTYMKPFSAAIANDLMDMMDGMGSRGGSEQDNRPILYVGTLIADDRSLKELYRKMEVIEVQENQRKGI